MIVQKNKFFLRKNKKNSIETFSHLCYDTTCTYFIIFSIQEMVYFQKMYLQLVSENLKLKFYFSYFLNPLILSNQGISFSCVTKIIRFRNEHIQYLINSDMILNKL